MQDWFRLFTRSFLLALASAVACAGQVQVYDVSDGLPQNSATALTIDRFGLLWVGTEDGLARFDGDRFVAFASASERGLIPGNYITALASDAHHVYIAVESGGLARFDLLRERFEPITVLDQVHQQPLNAWCMVVDGDRLLVGTRDLGLFALDRRNPSRILGHWHAKAPGIHQLPLRSVRDIALDPARKGYWVGGEGGLAFIRRDDGLVRMDDLNGVSHAPGEPDVAGIAVAESGEIWIGLRGHGLLLRPASSATFKPIPTPGALAGDALIVNRIALERRGGLVAATDRGLLRHDPGCDCLQALDDAVPDSGQLATSLFLTVLADGDFIWGGSWNRGLMRLHPGAAGFDLIKPAELGGEGAPVTPRSLYVDRKSRLWIGTFGNGAYYATIDSGSMRDWSWRHWASTQESSDRHLWAFAEGANGDMYIGSDAGITRMREDGRVDRIDLDSGEMDTLRSLLPASDGNLYASTVGGIYRIDPGSLAATRFSGAQGLTDTRVYALAEWPRGRLLIGTWSGLFSMPLNGTSVTPHALTLTGKDYSPRLVWDLFPDIDGSLWAGTSTGLLHLRANSPEIARYSETDGLPNQVVYTIEAAAGNELWVSTNRGIARFDKQTRRALAFDTRDGLQGDEFGFGMAAHDATGALYFAGLNGVNRLLPASVNTDPRPPRALITQLLLRNRVLSVGERGSDRVVLGRSLQATEQIVLSYRDADLGFSFSALGSDRPDRLRFQYRLEGYDGDWIEAGTRRFVGYTNLKPASYRFLVRALDRFDHEGPARILAIHIEPPLWATWPFRFLATAVLLALIMLALRWRFASLTRSRAALAAEVARQTERIRIQNEQLEMANQALFDRSIRDPLTGAFNRRHFTELAEQAYLDCRTRQQPFALVLIDVDHFKQVNDRHGHAAGDAVLCAIVQTLRPLLGHHEALGRFGGEEFLIMLPNHDADLAARRAEAMRNEIAMLRVASPSAMLSVTASFGVADAHGTDQPSLEALLARADAALYQAKADGRDRVQIAPRQ